MARHIIEGEWSGYRSSQAKIVHREVTTNEKLADWVRNAWSISYTDGTYLILTVRPANPRERVKQRLGYKALIHDCFRHNVTSVDALQAALAEVPQ